MAEAITKETLQKLLSLARQEQETKEGLGVSPIQEQLRAGVRQWMERLLDQEGHLMTPAVREAADWLYDCPGLPTVIAETLGINVGQLRVRLARQRQRPCHGCQAPVTVRELRCIGGYTLSTGRVWCSKCEREMEAARREAHEETIEDRAAEQARQADIERRIMAAARRGQAPWKAVPELLPHLVAYAVVWSMGATSLFTNGAIYAGVHGCQICGSRDVRLFVATPDYALELETTENYAWRALWRDAEDEPPSIYHALWRINPHGYFSWLPLTPLLHLPLILLCDEHAVVAEGRYLEIPVGQIIPQKVGDDTYQVTVSGTGGQYLLKRLDRIYGYWQVTLLGPNRPG